jgi:DNA processing protein
MYRTSSVMGKTGGELMTQATLDFQPECPARAVSPYRELGAYEALWMQAKASLKRIADIFREQPDALPSDLVPRPKAEETARRVVELLRDRGVQHFGVRVHRAGEYPDKLRDAANPLELLYYQGTWDFVESRCIAVVGTRKPSPEAVKRTKRLVRELVGDDWTIVSGLATGVDTVAHETALEHGGRTIAVIGTPLSESYPKENAELQARIAKEFLVISQVPVMKYGSADWRINRGFFPERNVTMSALTAATIIVEAGETSGTLTQARAALAQKRKLFILDSCFKVPGLTWPHKYESKGALRIESFDQIKAALTPQSAS